LAELTLFSKAASWYLGANIPGKKRIFMPYVGGVSTYRERCEAVAAANYEGFELSDSRPAGAPGLVGAS
jgi:cyclohexanone monooxygenase